MKMTPQAKIPPNTSDRSPRAKVLMAQGPVMQRVRRGEAHRPGKRPLAAKPRTSD